LIETLSQRPKGEVKVTYQPAGFVDASLAYLTSRPLAHLSRRDRCWRINIFGLHFPASPSLPGGDASNKFDNRRKQRRS
jgi:hypothetical protein